MNISRLSLCLLFTFCTFENAWSYNTFKAAAVVGEKITTEQDLTDRIAFIFLASDQKVPTDPTALNQIRSEVLKLMMEESLKRQVAVRFNLLPTKEEIQAAIENIAQQNGKDAEDLENFVEKNGISFEVFRQHIIAELAWRNYLRERYSAAVRVNDQEVEDIRRRLEAGQAIPGLGGLDATLYTYGQVTLSLEDGASQKIIDQKILQAESLGNTAKSLKSLESLSKSLPGAVYTGKELVQESEMLPGIVRLLESIKPGESTKPIISEIGIVFFFLKDRREVRGSVPEDEQIRRALTDERLNRFSKKALEELSRSVFMEIRG
ncbi:MAG: hypothetical protein GY915_02735 [bacterium]|nr:hypothetical protein [bacterium]